MFKYQKPVLCAWTGALLAAGMFAAPLAEARDTTAVPSIHRAEQVLQPVPAPVTKGIQQLVRLVPELASRHVVLRGEVDGPGVSGIAVSFLRSSDQTGDEVVDEAIFDAETGNLLVLSLQPQAAEQPAGLSVAQVKARAAAFVAGLQKSGNTYYAADVTSNEAGLTTVRLVRKLNHVLLDDDYDTFVTFDAGGRLIGFRTFYGKLHEAISPAALPSAQRVISVEQAAARFAENNPLEKVYLIPSQAQEDQSVAARLVYLMKDGITTRSHTGGAVDAVSGQPLVGQKEKQQPPKLLSQTAVIEGTGEKWSALTAEQAAEVMSRLFRAEPGTLPLVTFDDVWGSSEVRIFIWGHFREDAADADKQYQLGDFPEGVTQEQKKHLMLVTDGKTGDLIRFVQIDQTAPSVKRDQERDWQLAKETLSRLLPAGENQLRLRGSREENTYIMADPIVNGIPVYRESQTSEEAMYTVIVNGSSGSIVEVQQQRPANLVYPQASSAISGEEAVERLLQKFPLVLTYLHLQDSGTGEGSWKLAYDLSFRQTRAHCFCGPEPLVDETILVDALTGDVVVKE